MADILLIEDDELLASGLAYHLEKQGHTTRQAGSVAAARAAIQSARPTLALLDVNLPDGSGFAFGKELAQAQIPMIFLTAHDLDEEVLAAFQLGAEDYITKPFSLQIALARIGAVLRRVQPKPAADLIRCGELTLNGAMGTAFLRGAPLALTPTETRLLWLLAQHPGQLLTRSQLLERLWDDKGDFVDEHTLTLNISRLRAKLGEGYIQTVYGMGYKWVAAP